VSILKRALLARLTADLRPRGLIRHGNAFRYFEPSGSGIVVELQGSYPRTGEYEFYVNAAILYAPHLRFFMASANLDPMKRASAVHGVWQHRLINPATGDLDPATGSIIPSTRDHRFILATDGDVDAAFAAITRWLDAQLPTLKTWLTGEAMVAAAYAHGESTREASAHAKLLIEAGELPVVDWPEGHWSLGPLEVYLADDRGDLEAVESIVDRWPTRPPHAAGTMPHHLLELASERSRTASTADSE
jgi:hypothetical protein